MKTRDERAFWQRAARFYARFAEGSGEDFYREMGDRIKVYLRATMSVLELACGSGQLSFTLAPYVHQWLATDFSQAMVDEGRKRLEESSQVGNLRFRQQDATALSFDDSRFDAVVVANALQVMPHSERALSEIHRVLKPGGYLFAPTLVADEAVHLAWRFKLLKPFGFRLYQRWSASSFVDFVSSQGFTILESPIFGKKNLPICGLVAQKDPG